jgi:hypothetical protein
MKIHTGGTYKPTTVMETKKSDATGDDKIR